MPDLFIPLLTALDNCLLCSLEYLNPYPAKVENRVSS